MRKKKMQNQNWKKNVKSIQLLKLNELRKEGWKKKKFKNQQFIFADYQQIFANGILKELVKMSPMFLEFAGLFVTKFRIISSFWSEEN